MKRRGCSIVFVNSKGEYLLFLRDDKPGLPYRNMWDLLGGHVEDHETPKECIVREMAEEIEIELKDFELYAIYNFTDRMEYVFWKKADFDLDTMKLNEGQRLKYFTADEVSKTKLAYGFNRVMKDIIKSAL